MLGPYLSLVPRPPARALVPTLAMLAAYLLCRDGLALGATVVPGVAVGVLVFVVLTLGRRVVRQSRAGKAVLVVLAVAVILLGIAALGLIAPTPLHVQAGWVVVALVFSIGFAGFVFYGDETDLSALPSKWARVRAGPERRSALTHVAARHAFDTMVAAAVMRWASVDVWVLYATAGRLATWYVTEALIYRMLLRTRGV